MNALNPSMYYYEQSKLYADQALLLARQHCSVLYLCHSWQMVDLVISFFTDRLAAHKDSYALLDYWRRLRLSEEEGAGEIRLDAVHGVCYLEKYLACPGPIILDPPLRAMYAGQALLEEAIYVWRNRKVLVEL